jgi:hypothetical protein
MTVHSHTSAGPSSPAPEDCCPRVLFGWSPPSLPADTPAKRWVDRWRSTGAATALYYAAVIALLLLAPYLRARAELAVDGIAALAAGGWCAVNFWRCRHAHCLVTGVGWLALSGLAFVEAGIGRSLISGDEQVVFLAVLFAGLAFEAAWFLARGTNALTAAAYPSASQLARYR